MNHLHEAKDYIRLATYGEGTETREQSALVGILHALIVIAEELGKIKAQLAEANTRAEGYKMPTEYW